MNINEGIFFVLLITGVFLSIYYIFKEKNDQDDFTAADHLTIDFLCESIRKVFNDIINMDIYGLNLNRRDLDNRKALKRTLSDAIRKCSQGNLSEKMVVAARIKSSLSNNLGITEAVIDKTIPFGKPGMLSATDMFEIMMYLQKRDGSHHIFREICRQTDIDRLKKDDQDYYYSITKEDIKKAYDKMSQPLSYDDKLNILTQRIYEETYGLSVVDMMIMEDDSLDSISGGISCSRENNYRYREDDIYYGEFQKLRTCDSIWIIYGGKSIHMKFLSFPSSSKIIRVCKNLSEYGCIGHLTSSEGGLKTHLADGSRVTVFRPNNSSQWAFFVRKFTSAASFKLRDLITDKGKEYPIGVINWAIKGCLNLIFSGDQNSGKTTNTRAAVSSIDRRQPIRTIEADFELYLNDAYRDKNILGTRPSERMGFAKLIELLKASDAHTILFGETASLEHAKHLIDLLLAGTKRIITTGHWPTPDDMISYFVHSMGGYGTTGTEDVEALVSGLLHLDVHCVKENDGHRHIDRITEIIPYAREEREPVFDQGVEGRLELIAHYLKLMTRRKSYYTRDIIVYEDGGYKMIHPISDGLSKVLIKNLPPEEIPRFLEFNAAQERGRSIV